MNKMKIERVYIRLPRGYLAPREKRDERISEGVDCYLENGDKITLRGTDVAFIVEPHIILTMLAELSDPFKGRGQTQFKTLYFRNRIMINASFNRDALRKDAAEYISYVLLMRRSHRSSILDPQEVVKVKLLFADELCAAYEDKSRIKRWMAHASLRRKDIPIPGLQHYKSWDTGPNHWDVQECIRTLINVSRVQLGDRIPRTIWQWENIIFTHPQKYSFLSANAREELVTEFFRSRPMTWSGMPSDWQDFFFS